jgi:transposase
MNFITPGNQTLTGGYMGKISKTAKGPKALFMGIDVHEKTYSVSLFFEGEELLNESYPADHKFLRKLLDRYSDFKIFAAYEAGPFGYGLDDWLKANGVESTVAAPSKIPIAAGDRVKTDKRDARRLAQLLSQGMLTAVSVPEIQKRADRDLLRTRGQLVSQRRRIFSQIQSKLMFHSITLRSRGIISKRHRKLILDYPGIAPSLRSSFKHQLDAYDYYSGELQAIRREILALSESKPYKQGMAVLTSIPGVGLLTALHFLLELPDMRLFDSNEKVGSYLGLTCSEYSSGESQRQGHITRCGNARLRGLLVQSAWRAISGDPVLKKFYEKLKRRRGGKRAIVAVARKLSGRMRTILLKNEKYQVGLVQ